MFGSVFKCRTVASALNSLAAVTSEDIVSTGLNIKINPEKGAVIAKWMSLGYVNVRIQTVQNIRFITLIVMYVIINQSIFEIISCRYGILSFLLVFVVEQLGGILQATLTLNGLIGGVTLGLFSLGVFFKSANAKVKQCKG